ncbi:ATP-binding protein [Shewanella sp. C32]|uniref:histidine kinase n=1 Tax=Shewanella electrica TaxID=515560 RepID=A0ABT2FLD8_9GAMM|nr:ATP-binding protein [Shewanella electrica]MCH1925535.1 ATP-binding protein [Shewanella electrica]MCS4557158.1 ATP-binding protein [Shewanella electrica]
MGLSVEGKLTAVLIIALGAAAASVMVSSYWQWPIALSLLVAGLLGGGVGLVVGRSVTRRINHGLQALDTGLMNFQDNDFSVSLSVSGNDELSQLAQRFNQASDSMRKQRADIFQRELLLDTVLQNTSLAILLADEQGRVLFANIAARHLLGQGSMLEHKTLAEVSAANEDVAAIITQPRDGVFSILRGDEQQIWHLSYANMRMNGMALQLYQFKPLTQELTQAEIQTWKKVIRVISHELNNSLAPISSMAHSGQKLLQHTADPALLQKIFTTIAERSAHLHSFLQEYADFARLPQPHAAAFYWRDLLETLRGIRPFTLVGELPTQASWGDRRQLAQVLVNLFKNASEAGTAEQDITLEIRQTPHRQWLMVCDRGSGMSDETLRNALLPFYSTKTEGTGLGLALCREIIENHGGQMAIRNRDGGGLEVSFWLPMPPEDASARD